MPDGVVVVGCRTSALSICGAGLGLDDGIFALRLGGLEVGSVLIKGAFACGDRLGKMRMRGEFRPME